MACAIGAITYLAQAMGFSVRLDPSSTRVLRDGHDDEVALAELKSADDHIHGQLIIAINDVVVPGLGFFGPGDVCIGEWAAFFAAAVPRLREREQIAVTFDDYEQGQPAFVFERDGDKLTISSADSASGPADSSWTPQTCGLDEFYDGVDKFLASVRETLHRFAPTVGASWFDSQIRRGLMEPV